MGKVVTLINDSLVMHNGKAVSLYSLDNGYYFYNQRNELIYHVYRENGDYYQAVNTKLFNENYKPGDYIADIQSKDDNAEAACMMFGYLDGINVHTKAKIFENLKEAHWMFGNWDHFYDAAHDIVMPYVTFPNVYRAECFRGADWNSGPSMDELATNTVFGSGVFNHDITMNIDDRRCLTVVFTTDYSWIVNSFRGRNLTNSYDRTAFKCRLLKNGDDQNCKPIIDEFVFNRGYRIVECGTEGDNTKLPADYWDLKKIDPYRSVVV